jgi:hypothetical protein
VSSSPFERVALEIAADNREDLEELSAILVDGAVVGAIEPTAQATDLHFDPTAVGTVAVQVVVVVTKVGGAIRLADWVRRRLEERKHKLLVITVGEDRIEIPADADPERTRRLLAAALNAA